MQVNQSAVQMIKVTFKVDLELFCFCIQFDKVHLPATVGRAVVVVGVVVGGSGVIVAVFTRFTGATKKSMTY